MNEIAGRAQYQREWCFRILAKMFFVFLIFYGTDVFFLDAGRKLTKLDCNDAPESNIGVYGFHFRQSTGTVTALDN